MSQWVNICKVNDIIPATGVCALLGTEQFALMLRNQTARQHAGLKDESHSVKHYDVRVKDGNVQLRG